MLSRPNSEEARSAFLDRLSPTDQAIVLRTAEISGPGPRDPDWLIAEASAAAADRISEVVGRLSASPLVVDEAQVTSAAVAGVNEALAAVGDAAVAKAAGPRIEAAISRIESARSWMHVMYATAIAIIILAAFALAEARYVHDSAFSDGYRAGARATQQTNAHRH